MEILPEFGRRRQYQQIEDEMAAFYEETQNKQVVVEEELKEYSLVALRQDRRWHRSAIPSNVQARAFRKSCQPQPPTGRL